MPDYVVFCRGHPQQGQDLARHPTWSWAGPPTWQSVSFAYSLGEPPSELCSYTGNLETPFLPFFSPPRAVWQLRNSGRCPAYCVWNKHKLICSCTLQDQTHQFVQRIPCFAAKNGLWMKITPGFGFYGYYRTKENSNCVSFIYLFPIKMLLEQPSLSFGTILYLSHCCWF